MRYKPTGVKLLLNNFLGCPVIVREKWFCVDGNFWSAIGKTYKEAIDNMEHVLGNEWKQNKRYPHKES